MDTANAEWTWLSTQEAVIQNYSEISTLRHTTIPYAELPFHPFYDKLFTALSLPIPDSLYVGYRYVIEGSSVKKQIDSKVLFLNVDFGVLSDEPASFPNVQNPENFEAFRKEYDCCYSYVYGFADFQLKELTYVFGEGAWANRVRHIMYGPNQYLKIHSEGNKSTTTRVYLNDSLVDSTYVAWD